MKLKINSNEYSASNCRVKVSEDLKEIEAWSYGHWKFVATDKVGNVFFNDTNYSPSTRGHQNNAQYVMRNLGIEASVRLHNTRQDFDYGITDALNSEISSLESQNAGLLELTQTPRTHRRKNDERREKIQTNEYRIKDLIRIRDEYLDKKLIPIERDPLEPIESFWAETIGYFEHPTEKKKFTSYNYEKDVDEILWESKTIRFEADHSDPEKHAKVEAYKTHFRKQNGKLQTDQFLKFINKVDLHYDVPNIEPIKPWLNVKGGESVEFILLYEHSRDIPGMLPNIDSKEGILLQKWVKKRSKHPKNVLLMDKLHTYLVNKMNRKSYVPGVPNYFPMNEKFESLEGTPKLRLIKTDHALRAEGRRQSHCIGSRDYIRRCREGCHALNYKDYTFFLDAELNVIQTNGSHNRETPEDIVEELESLIKAA